MNTMIGVSSTSPSMRRVDKMRGVDSVRIAMGQSMNVRQRRITGGVGSGTTGEVAVNLGRRFIGIDLQRAYEPLARARIGLWALTA